MNITDLVQGFSKHIKDYKSAQYKESELRQQFIDPFWRALGWDVGDRAQLGPAQADVIIEKTVDTAAAGGFANRRPDYIFRLGGFPRFTIEAKKPFIDLDTDDAAIFQAKMNSWNSTIPFAILTDFEQFRLYDTTLKPLFKEPTRGLVKEFRLDYHDYEAQWDVIAATFSRAAVEAGSLEELLSKIKKIKPGKRLRTVDRTLFDLKGAEPVDREFLAYLDTHRRHLAVDLYKQNKAAFPEPETHHGAAKLTEAVQRIMDRLVFMRVIEDRGIVKWGALRDTLQRIGTEGGDFYEALTAVFRDYDARYNGYLYKTHFSETLTVSGEVLADFTRALYPPDGPWNFALIGDDLLGIVYERFLGNVVTVKQTHVDIEEKLEVRHAGGVYYTPRFIVDSIIRRVIGPQLKDKTPAQVLEVKILDPACGSGSFLVAALQYLFDYCLDAVHTDPAVAKAHVPALGAAAGAKGRKKKSEIAFKDADGRWYLAPDFRAALLTHCIHGVDIDKQAVEVTVMSLYLKMLESKLPENWATLWVEKQLLPTLDNNIRCGNSLIDEADYYAFREKHDRNQKALFPSEAADTTFRINRFDWDSQTLGFGRLMRPDPAMARDPKQRIMFDCIIGNPPYIRVQELNKWAPEECEFYKWKYASARKGNYDIYVVFTEKALSLLAPEGLLGFIMPHKFWQAQYGEGLRNMLLEGRNLLSVVDFAHQQVFQGATTYTAVHVIGRSRNDGVISFARFHELIDGLSQCAALDETGSAGGVETFNAPMPPEELPWRFVGPAMSKAFGAVASAATLTLGDAADRLFQGVRTSKNEVFVLRRIGGKRGDYVSEALGRQVELEPKLLKPFLGGDEIRRYALEPTDAVAIFPYTSARSGGGVDLIPAKEIAEKCPKTWAYLVACEKILRAREKGAMDHDQWYAFGRTQNLDLFGIPRILVPDMMDKASFALDEDGHAAFVSGYGVIMKERYTKLLPFITGLLNSALVSAFLKSVSTTLRGGWYRTFPQFLRQIPIKLPETAPEKKLAERITQSVRAIMDAKIALRAGAGGGKSPGLHAKPSTLSDREISQLQATIETQEKRIDEAVFELYGVAGLPST